MIKTKLFSETESLMTFFRFLAVIVCTHIISNSFDLEMMNQI